ncbi:MAG: GAF domain-containing protein [Deltaproteobacteria bacterium]|nr:GAF domain-containing protein [Deltaproteobacteria bacterium]
MRTIRYSFWITLAVYGIVALLWLLVGDWLIADTMHAQTKMLWDTAKDLAFVLWSLGLIAWLLARHHKTYREFSASYEGIFQSANDAFLLFDHTGTIIDANRKACELYGYPLEHLKGLTGRDIVHPDHYHLFEKFGRATEKELEQTIRSIDVRADGRSFPTEVRGAIISHQGKPHRLAIVRDVSARHTLEQGKVVTDQRLQEQLALLSLSAELGVALTKGSDLAEILQHCAELLVRHLDAAFARIWTLKSGEAMLHLVASAGMYTHLDGPHSRIPVGEAYKVGAIAFYRTPLLSNSVVGDPQITDQEWAKREGMVAFAGQPLLIGDKVVGVMGIFARHPLSEVVLQALGAVADEVALGIDRMWAEAELVQKNRALRTLSACNEILVRAQEEAKFLADICQAIIQQGGYKMAWVGLKENDPASGVRVAASAGDAVDYLTGIKTSWGDNEWGHGPTGKAIRTETLTYCNDVEHCDGFTPWREAAREHQVGSSLAIPLKQDGDTMGALNIYAAEAHGFGEAEVTLLQELAVDVAYGIKVLRERAEARKGVEEKVRLEQQVRQGQKMEAIGTLAGGIAHDFNNILAAILGFTDLAKYKLPEGSDLHHDLDNVIQAGQRAKELVKQILAFSRQAEQERRPLEMYLVLKEALKLLRASIPATIAFQLAIDEKSGAVLADPTKIHQVIMNLCTNAYHAMRANDSGLLGVALRPVEIGEAEANGVLRPGKYLELAISDTGCGMTPEIMERIFDPYFTTKPQGEGTGLGLAMVHGIVTQYGGEIRAESTLGQGTTFRVYLPQATREASGIERIVAQQLPGGNERVLVVDDEPTVLAMHTGMLERLGYQVTALPSSQEALAAFSSRPQEFDLILTDMAMPGMPGDVLAHKIRQLRADIPILMCTGFSEKLTPERAAAVGIGKIIMKPLLFRELATCIREFLDS